MSDGASGSLPDVKCELACALGANVEGLLRICASPLVAFQSALTFTSAPAAMPSSLVLSALLIEPAAEVVAALILMAGVVPPDETMGAVPVTLVTCAVLDTLPKPTSNGVCVCAEGAKVAGLPVREFQSTGGDTAATAAAKSVMLAATCVWLDGVKVEGFPVTLSHASVPLTSPGGPCAPCGPAGPCGPTRGMVTSTALRCGTPTRAVTL